jgi:hypothetical protein
MCLASIVLLMTDVQDPDPPDPHVFGPPDPNPLVRGMDPDPDPSIIKLKY